MKPISSVIQGNESGLYRRVYNELVFCGACDKYMKAFDEAYKKLPFDEFVDYCHKCLTEAECY